MTEKFKGQTFDQVWIDELESINESGCIVGGLIIVLSGSVPLDPGDGLEVALGSSYASATGPDPICAVEKPSGPAWKEHRHRGGHKANARKARKGRR